MQSIDYGEWLDGHLAGDLKNGLRVGQSYLNRVHPAMTWPELFYEDSDHKAHTMIWNFEVQQSIELEETI